MKSNYVERACHFLQEIWPYIEDTHFDFCECKEAIKRYNETRLKKVQINFGGSRIAIIDSDYVIKFDYDGVGVIQGGGCQDEIKFYQFAKEHGFSHLFAESTPIYFKGRLFNIMPRIYGIGRYKDYVEFYLNDTDRDFVSNYLYDMHEENYGWKNNYPIIIDYACNVFLPPI